MSNADAENRNAIRRRKLLASVGGIALLPGATTRAAGETTSPSGGEGGRGNGRGGGSAGERHDRDEFPRIDDVPAEPISEYATQVAVHPNQRRAAITTGLFGDGFQLYVVQGVDGPDSLAETAWQVTDGDGLVAAMEWRANNRLLYDEDFTRYVRKLPPSHKRFEPEVVAELSFEGVNSL